MLYGLLRIVIAVIFFNLFWVHSIVLADDNLQNGEEAEAIVQTTVFTQPGWNYKSFQAKGASKVDKSGWLSAGGKVTIRSKALVDGKVYYYIGHKKPDGSVVSGFIEAATVKAAQKQPVSAENPVEVQSGQVRSNVENKDSKENDVDKTEGPVVDYRKDYSPLKSGSWNPNDSICSKEDPAGLEFENLDSCVDWNYRKRNQIRKLGLMTPTAQGGLMRRLYDDYGGIKEYRKERKKNWNGVVDTIIGYTTEPMFEADKKFARELNKLCNEYGLEAFCQPQSRSVGNQDLKKLVDTVNRKMIGEIPIKCIFKSAEGKDKKNKGMWPSQRYACIDDSAKNRNSGKGAPPCITANYVRNIHYKINRALYCINSSGGPTVTASEIFKIINHESRFQYNVRNTGGMGIMQLTGAGFSGFVTKKDKTFQNWNSVKGNELCAPFRKAMGRAITNQGQVVDIKNVKKGYYDICQFLEQGDGVSRNIIMGLSLYKYKLQQAENILRKTKYRGNKEVAQRVARLLYNQGSGAVEPALKALIDANFKSKNSDDLIQNLENAMVNKKGKKIYPKNNGYSTKADKDFEKVAGCWE